MGYYKEYRKWSNEKNDASQNLMQKEYLEWLEKNPAPIMSESEHREILNECLKEAKEKNDKRKKIFCPMAMSNCETSCETYEKAVVHNTTYEMDTEDGCIAIPRVTGGYCVCYALKGSR